MGLAAPARTIGRWKEPGLIVAPAAGKVGKVIRAVLGGTFDPPHLAHLVLAEAAYRQLGVAAVEFVPAGDPWWKSSPSPTPARHRLQMIRLATAPVSYFQVNVCEVRRKGPSYMADTLKTYPTGDEIYLVVGADVAGGLRSWMRWEEVAARVRLAVASRSGTDIAQVEEAAVRPPVWLDTPHLDISSEQVRRLCRAGRSIRFLVPEPVREYVAENRLYASGACL